MFAGSIVALITPLHKGNVDVSALKKLINWHVQEGTQGIVVCGSTGEGTLLTRAERRLTIETVVATAAKRLPVIVGCGAASTHETVVMTQEAKDLGADAALIVTPFYVKPTAEGIYQHYKTINDSVELPTILYNNPGRAVVGMSVDLVVRLSALRNVVAIKDSCDDLTRVIKMRQRITKPFSFLSGDDPIATAYVAHGGDGVISISANVMPRQCAQLMQAWQQGDLQTFATLRDRLLPLHEVMFVETNPSPVKYAVAQLGLCSEEVRMPLLPLSEHSRQQVKSIIEQAKALAA